MKRVLGSAVGLLIVLGALAPSALVQSDLEPTLAALQTQVADLSTRVAALESSGATSAQQTSPSRAADPTSTPADAVQAIDESAATLGSFRFAVTDVSEQSELSEENGFWSYTADGRYVIVTLEIENIGTRSLEFPFFEFVIEEQYGAQYDPQSLVIADLGEEYEHYDELIPGNVYIRKLVFDVPNEAVSLILRHEDQSIAIPLGI